MPKRDERDVPEARLIQEIRAWANQEGVRPGNWSDTRYVVCGGLAVLEHARKRFPLQGSDLLTPGNQVRTSGSLIKKVLARHGEHRLYSREGGRTTRGTRPAAERLCALLHQPGRIEWLQALSGRERADVLHRAQAVLMECVAAYFSQSQLKIEIDLARPLSVNVGQWLSLADDLRKRGAVAQHLYGAALALRFPDREIDNHSFTTADRFTGRAGDFHIEDLVVHVTVSPMSAVIEKCGDNLRNQYRPALLVPEDQWEAARNLARDAGILDRIFIAPLEVVLGQMVEELSEYRADCLGGVVARWLSLYNKRVELAETDHSIRFDIPENLFRVRLRAS